MQVALCKRFQITLLRILLDHKLNKLQEDGQYSEKNGSAVFNYLLLPFLGSDNKISIDWKCISAVQYPENASRVKHTDCSSNRGHSHYMHTKNGLVCCCMLENSLVCTPHNGLVYCINGTCDGFDGNTYLELRGGESVTYKEYYKRRSVFLFLLKNYCLNFV